MRRFKTAAIAVVCVGVLLAAAGCNANGIAGESGLGDTPTVVVVDYNGHPLNCVISKPSRYDIKSCDFVEYHHKFGFGEGSE